VTEAAAAVAVVQVGGARGHWRESAACRASKAAAVEGQAPGRLLLLLLVLVVVFDQDGLIMEIV
jgi:hypothetical protein